jgi:hypothetical protein
VLRAGAGAGAGEEAAGEEDQGGAEGDGRILRSHVLPPVASFT